MLQKAINLLSSLRKVKSVCFHSYVSPQFSWKKWKIKVTQNLGKDKFERDGRKKERKKERKKMKEDLRNERIRENK